MALDAITSFFNTIVDAFKNFLTSIANAGAALASAIDFMKNFFDSIAQSIRNALDFLYNILKTIWDFFANLPSYVQQAFQWILDQIINFVKYIWNGMVWVFQQVYNMISSSISTIVNNIQCSLTGIYRKVRERIPTLLAYNAALFYTRRIVERGRPRDFLKVVPMALMAGLGGIALSSLLPDVPQDKCLEIMPLPITSIAQVFQPPQPMPVERVVTQISPVAVKDYFVTSLSTSTSYLDAVKVQDKLYFSTPLFQYLMDETSVVDFFTPLKAGQAISTDTVSPRDLFFTSIVKPTEYMDTVSITDTSSMSVLLLDMTGSGSTETPLMASSAIKDWGSGSTQTALATSITIKDTGSGSTQTSLVTAIAVKSEEIESGSTQSATACVNIDQLNIESCPERL